MVHGTTPADGISGTEVLNGEEFLLLLLTIGAVYAPWFKSSYPTIPRAWSVVFYRTFWFLIYGGVVAAIYSYFWASYGWDGTHHTGTFKIKDSAWHDITWVLIIVHLVHLKLLEIFTAVRYKRVEYWISTVVFVLAVLVSIALSILMFIQKVYGAGVAYAVLAAALIVIFIYAVWRGDDMSLNYMARLSGNELGWSKKKREEINKRLGKNQ